MRRTKIVCTIGPATREPAALGALMAAGMDVARLNFSHGTAAGHARAIADIRSAAKRLGRCVAILQDLAGPKVRTGPVKAGSVILEPGARFTLTSRAVPGDSRAVSLTYKGLPKDVQRGDRVLLCDGAIELKVEETTRDEIRCRVIVGGALSSHKGINLPSRTLNTPFLTAKDRADIAFGIARGVDCVALSFVRSAEDVKLARRAIVRCGGSGLPVIAKIEKHEALRDIDRIIEAVDGIMVARGDLGVEIPVEQIPRAQKTLIEKANQAGKPVITATQMLKSMTENPRPTRAEVTDVANAILDGTDAVMLSEETAVGSYPVGAVKMMSRIAVQTEASFPYDARLAMFDSQSNLDRQEAVAYSACRLAAKIGAAAIITCTQSGSTTRFVAKYRPNLPVLAMTPDPATYRRLALVWGAVPLMMGRADSQERMEREAVRLALRSGHVKKGDAVVITAGMPLHVPGMTNMIRVVVAGNSRL